MSLFHKKSLDDEIARMPAKAAGIVILPQAYFFFVEVLKCVVKILKRNAFAIP